MVRGVNRDRERLAVLAEIEVGASRMHALEATSNDRPAATWAVADRAMADRRFALLLSVLQQGSAKVIRGGKSAYHNITNLTDLEESMGWVLVAGDCEALLANVEVWTFGAFLVDDMRWMSSSRARNPLTWRTP